MRTLKHFFITTSSIFLVALIFSLFIHFYAHQEGLTVSGVCLVVFSFARLMVCISSIFATIQESKQLKAQYDERLRAISETRKRDV
jgi:hypothetical protein